jgi:hypothetical protein
MEPDRKMKGCGACLHAPENVPYIVHESAQARMERVSRRLWITVILLIALLVATNGAWLWYESQFETITVGQELTGGIGDISRASMIGVGDYYGNNQADGDDPAEEAGRQDDAEP